MNRSARSRRLRTLVLAVNTLGLLLFLAWLAGGGQRIFHTQDGVLYLLPCLPFFFVYALLGRGAGEGAADEDEEGEAALPDEPQDEHRR